ncbi:MAG: hypothetical protein ACI9IV_001579 [Paracoccaceae bacterium]
MAEEVVLQIAICVDFGMDGDKILERSSAQKAQRGALSALKWPL